MRLKTVGLVAIATVFCACGDDDESSQTDAGDGSSATSDPTTTTGSSSSSTTASGATSDGSGSGDSTGAGSSGTDTGSSSDGSTGAAAFCGDGTQDADEECDDANAVAGDGCELDCSLSRNYVFATSTLHDGNFGGLAGADAVCNQLATDAGLPGAFVAYLSTTTVNARDRLGTARGWIRPDGRAFADTVDDAVSPPWYPASIDETGAPVSETRAYSATDASGMFVPGSSNCDEWTSPSGGVTGGFPHSTGWLWAGHTPGGYSCGLAQHHIYCFGTDHQNPVTPEPVVGRAAFITHGGWSPGGGTQSADALCQSEADGAGIPGSFRALLAGETSAATDRFDLTGPVWVRPDGVAIVEDAADLATAQLLAPFYVGPDGVREPNGAWTGAGDPGAASPGGSCGDWLLTTGQAARGNQRTILHALPGSSWFGMWPTDCGNGGGRLYCLEQ